MFKIFQAGNISEAGWRRELSPLCWAFSLFVFLPNTIFWLMSHWFVMERPVINLDYIFIGILIARGWVFSGLLLFTIFFLADVLVLISQMYPFLRFADLIYLMGLLMRGPTYVKLVVIFAFLFLFSASGLLAWQGRKTTILSVLIPFNLGLLFYGAYVYGGNNAEVQMWRPNRGVFVDSQTINFIEGRTMGFVETFSFDDKPFTNTGYHGRTVHWAAAPVEKLNPKLLLIIAESWGYYLDEKTQAAITAPIFAKKNVLDWIETGSMSVDGATVTAELRELCGLYPNNFNLKKVETGFEGCLPNKLRAAGYETEAIHGAVGLMYDRLYWYPRVGFSKSHFMETDAWKSRCYSFPGICDREIAADYIANVFSKTGKQFVYWMTLNSHALYDERDLQNDHFNCASHGLPEGTNLCRMSKLHVQFFENLADILDKDSMRGVEVLIVGDHMPRMVETEDGRNYIEQDAVSWLHFKIKGSAE